MLTNGYYTGKSFEKAVEQIFGAEVEIAKRNELHKFKVIPKDGWLREVLLG